MRRWLPLLVLLGLLGAWLYLRRRQAADAQAAAGAGGKGKVAPPIRWTANRAATVGVGGIFAADKIAAYFARHPMPNPLPNYVPAPEDEPRYRKPGGTVDSPNEFEEGCRGWKYDDHGNRIAVPIPEIFRCPTLLAYRTKKREVREFLVEHIPDGARPVLYDDDGRQLWHAWPVGYQPQTDAERAEQENKDLHYQQFLQVGSKLPASWLDVQDMGEAYVLFNPAGQLGFQRLSDIQTGALQADQSRYYLRLCRTTTERAVDRTEEQKDDAILAVKYIGSVVSQIVNAFVPGSGAAINGLINVVIVNPIEASVALEQLSPSLVKQLGHLLKIDPEVYYTSDGTPFRRRSQLFQNGADGVGWVVPWLNHSSGCLEGDVDTHGLAAAKRPYAFDGSTFGGGDAVAARRQAFYAGVVYRVLDVLASSEHFRDQLGIEDTEATYKNGLYHYINPIWGECLGSVFPPTHEDYPIRAADAPVIQAAAVSKGLVLMLPQEEVAPAAVAPAAVALPPAPPAFVPSIRYTTYRGG